VVLGGGGGGRWGGVFWVGLWVVCVVGGGSGLGVLFGGGGGWAGSGGGSLGVGGGRGSVAGLGFVWLIGGGGVFCGWGGLRGGRSANSHHWGARSGGLGGALDRSTPLAAGTQIGAFGRPLRERTSLSRGGVESEGGPQTQKLLSLGQRLSQHRGGGDVRDKREGGHSLGAGATRT